MTITPEINSTKTERESISEKIEVVKEIRFAVVLYGGVSLAIYINGVAQELLKMVRATAVSDDATEFRFSYDELDNVEEIYRDLAYLLADENLAAKIKPEYLEWLKKHRPTDENPVVKETKGKKPKVVRFVVDIVSGTSAGGINGIFMAKALASGQDIKQLEQLWEDEGNFSSLLRDEQSLLDEIGGELGLPALKQSSLLNSERMYLKLLKAFNEMDKPEKAGDTTSTPFVDEVDLFVTTTDYWGIPVPIKLYDRLIHERRHRQVFRLKFRGNDKSVNDFQPEMNPFLAYTARCTSSFPLAFDPMQLTNANSVIEAVKKHSGQFPDGGMKDALWQRFFNPVTLDGLNEPIKWHERVFVDGGYLDNKPFGYAIEALAQKQSNVLVDRKLLYVEPKPEPDDALMRANNYDQPGALTNTLAAVTSLPTYETIREDLQQVLQRNRLVLYVNSLVHNARRDELDSFNLSLGELEETIQQQKKRAFKLTRLGRKLDWSDLELGELAHWKGQAANSYYRLRVASLTDDLARMVTRRAGFDENSDYFFAVRDLVRFWRGKNYGKGEGEEHSPATPMSFLTNFDYNYRLRRLRFVLQQADRLLRLEADLIEELNKTKKIAENFRQSAAKLNIGVAEKSILRELFPLLEQEVFDSAITAENTPSAIILNAQKDDLQQAVREVKKDINRILNNLRRLLRRIEPDASENLTEEKTDIAALVNDLKNQVELTSAKLGTEGLNELLGKTDGNAGSSVRLETDLDLKERLERTNRVVAEKKVGNNLYNIGETLRQIYNDDPNNSIFAQARNAAQETFDSPSADVLRRAVRDYLRQFYENFDGYDQILFPVMYETPIGEGVIVDVARISPLDAPNLIDEQDEIKLQKDSQAKKENPPYRAKRKVAGSVFFSFGAFFDRGWRRNDILWGRLDAVERLVSIVLSEADLRQEIIAEAHETILENSDLMKEAKQATPTKQRQQVEPNRIFTDFVRHDYAINRNLPKEGILEATSRSLTVLQKVFDTEELGKIAKPKDFAIENASRFIKPDSGDELLTGALKPYLNWALTRAVILGLIMFALPTLILCVTVSLWLQSCNFYWLGGGILTVFVLVGTIIHFVRRQAQKLYREQIQNRLQKLKDFLSDEIVKKVTGS